MTGHRRKQHIPISQLRQETGLPTVNHLVAECTLLDMWGILHSEVPFPSNFKNATPFSGSRSETENKLRGPNLKHTPANWFWEKGVRLWNAAPQSLRKATSRQKYKIEVKKYVSTLPF